MTNPKSLLMPAVRYDDLPYTGADYEAVRAIYENVKASHGFELPSLLATRTAISW